MVRFSGIAMIVLGIVHLLVLGVDVPTEAGRWLGLNLWTFEHWQALRTQPVDLALSNGIFWATIGSFAVPVMVLGAFIVHADKQGWQIPAWIGWALFGWTVLASLIMAPSGFPVAALIMLILAVGLQRNARA